MWLCKCYNSGSRRFSSTACVVASAAVPSPSSSSAVPLAEWCAAAPDHLLLNILGANLATVTADTQDQFMVRWRDFNNGNARYQRARRSSEGGHSTFQLLEHLSVLTALYDNFILATASQVIPWQKLEQQPQRDVTPEGGNSLAAPDPAPTYHQRDWSLNRNRPRLPLQYPGRNTWKPWRGWPL